MKRPTTAVAVGTLVLFIFAAPVFAQHGPPPPGGNHSDDTGPGHGHDHIGGDGHDNDHGHGNDNSHGNGHGGMAAAILNAQSQVIGALTTTNASFSAVSTSATTHAAVASVGRLVQDRSGATGSAAQVTNALAGSGASPAQIAALVQGVAGLATTPVLDGGNAAEARIRAAAASYNAFVRAASPKFLESPPEEFLALRGALAPLVRALDPRNNGLLATLAP